jgi:uncharacterized protein (TIGR03000 family)
VLVLPGAADDNKKDDPKVGTLLIKLPADARLQIDGKVIPGVRKSERTFKTPPLGPGKKYTCTVKAIWAPNGWTTITRTRKVEASPGKTTVVDLRKADPKQPDDFFIRYVTTPTPVVEAMLKLARVGKGDVVYDLGCGDGRIVVTAVAKFGAKRGVGVDIDLERISDSKLTAKKAGVTDRVEFLQGDARKVKNLDKATVVCLYLGEELNEQLRPILQKTLKPGTRIVSHRFAMGDWKPDETRTVSVGATQRTIYLWKIRKKDSKTTPDR